MSNTHGLKVSKPISAWNRPLQADFKKLFVGLTKSVSQVAVMNWGSAIKEAVEAVSVIDLEKNAGQIAWLLIYRSITQAMYSLVEENLDLIKSSPESLWHLRDNQNLSEDDLKALSEKLNLSLENSELVVDEEFFMRPAEISVLKNIRQPFFQWLNEVGLEKHQARTISDRLPTYFIYALNEQWRTYRQDYELLTEALDTPFTKASDTEQAWACYSAWLKKQVEEPMFYEAFSLRQVYIPLRAFYERKTMGTLNEDGIEGSREFDKVVVNLEEELSAWLYQSDIHDSIRVISGGPGCGKSSFTKMFAAKHIDNRDRRVLFIPLHRFDPTDDLVEAVGRFVQFDGVLSNNPLDPINGESRLLIIFDGLDELSMQGKVAAEVAQRFIQEVRSKVMWFNSREPRIKVLISGRELAIQSNSTEFRKEKQIFHILPYFVSSVEAETFIDPSGLVRTEISSLIGNALYSGPTPNDQRQQWWENYGRISGKGYTEMPKVLERKELEEITSQPLLNYLISLSYARGKVNFAEETNINLIYKDLLNAVYQRAWADSQHPAIRDISENDFVRILEEIAIAAWHGDRRTTTVKEIEAHCISSGISILLGRFKEGFKEGIGRLLMAFYFRKFGNSATGDETFEFTHKSFGEYLSAMRIVRGIKRIHEELERRDKSYDSGWDERESLTNWIKLCGPTPMNQYLFDFILHEIYIQKPDLLHRLQEDLCRLIESVLKYGLPFEKLEMRPPFKEEIRQARNAEETLLAVLSATSQRTKRISRINWETQNTFSEWIQRLQGHRIGTENSLVLSHLQWLDLSGCQLNMTPFHKAVFNHADLRNISASNAFFGAASFHLATLQRGDFYGANFTGADLSSSNLEEANLQHTKLQDADLKNTNLFGADLRHAYLKNANLFESNLQKANLTGANLDNVNLYRADLGRASLEAANLHKAILEGANLYGANIRSANLSGAKLQGARWIDGRIIKAGSVDNLIF